MPLGLETTKRVKENEGIIALFYTLVFLIGIPAFALLLIGLFHVFSFLNERIEDKVVLAQWGGLVILIVGTLLFLLRERKRKVYAVLEIAFGVVTGGVAISQAGEQGDFAVWIAVVGSSYLVVRGMDNMQKSGFALGETWEYFLSSRLIRRHSNVQGDTSMARSTENVAKDG